MKYAAISVVLASLGLSVVFGCSPAQPAPAAVTEPEPAEDTAFVPQGSPEPEPARPGPEALEIIRPGEIVPAFELTAEDGTVLDSRELVGKRPFVMVFFASWCGVCERKLPEVKEALAGADDMLVIGVALDNPDTWDRVHPYVQRHGMERFKLVNGQANRRFATAYNPFGSVPIVEVIDRSGIIAELQRGWQPGHREELIAALEHVSSTAM